MAVAKLEHLQEFLYLQHSNNDLEQLRTAGRSIKLTRLCVRLLPWLHISGHRFKFELGDYNAIDLFGLACFRLRRRLPSLELFDAAQLYRIQKVSATFTVKLLQPPQS
jgi:hypothetical protein